MITKEKIQEFIKKSVDWLKDQDIGCTTLKLDDRLAICVGWLSGYGDEVRDDVIQSKSQPDWGINAGVKVWTSDDMRTDYEYIKMPYYANGDVIETDVSLDPSDEANNYEDVARWLLAQYEDMKDLDIEEDGLIKEEHEEEVEVSDEEEPKLTTDDMNGGQWYESKEESLKEDLIVVKPDEAKEKLDALKHQIENEDTPETKNSLIELMSIYLFQTYKPSDRESSSITDEEWQEYSDWLNKEKGIEEVVKEDKGLDLETAIKVADEDVLDDVFGKDSPERKLAGAIKHCDDEHVCEKCGKNPCECLHEEVDKEALEFYVKNWHEGDNITVTADLLNVLEKSLEMVNKYKESCEKGENKKDLKETWDGENVIDDLVDRAKSNIDEGADLDDAIMSAIDEGLIYTSDIYDLAQHYGSLDDSEIIESYYDDLYSDVYSQVEDYEPEVEDEESEEEEE